MTGIVEYSKEAILGVLSQVPDPEIPVINIIELGVVRDVQIAEEAVTIVITPTYSGCPAMDMIEVNIRAALQEAGYDNVQVQTILTPAWTTDWITAEARQKLKAYGIAPPKGSASKASLFADAPAVDCPHCDSTDTRLVSQFGSTPCKALYQCNSCKEPFDYFKCH